MESFEPLSPQDIEAIWDHVERRRVLTEHAEKILGEDKGRRWMGARCRALGGDTPNDRAATPEGAADVAAVLGRIAHGICS